MPVSQFINLMRRLNTNENSERISIKNVEYNEDGNVSAIEFTKTSSIKFRGDKCTYINVLNFIENIERVKRK